MVHDTHGHSIVAVGGAQCLARVQGVDSRDVVQRDDAECRCGVVVLGGDGGCRRPVQAGVGVHSVQHIEGELVGVVEGGAAPEVHHRRHKQVLSNGEHANAVEAGVGCRGDGEPQARNGDGKEVDGAVACLCGVVGVLHGGDVVLGERHGVVGRRGVQRRRLDAVVCDAVEHLLLHSLLVHEDGLVGVAAEEAHVQRTPGNVRGCLVVDHTSHGACYIVANDGG